MSGKMRTKRSRHWKINGRTVRRSVPAGAGLPDANQSAGLRLLFKTAAPGCDTMCRYQKRKISMRIIIRYLTVVFFAGFGTAAFGTEAAREGFARINAIVNVDHRQATSLNGQWNI